MDIEILNLYEQWLMATYPEEIRCKDDLIELSMAGYNLEEFVLTVSTSLINLAGGEEE